MFVDETKKSIQSILYERISSPLSGALFFSWFAWNWEIPYILLFNKSDLTIKERLIFIQEHINIYDSLLYPIISAIAIITIYPLLTTGALFIWMKYKKLQNDIKNTIEGSKVLTIEQSNRLRMEIKNQEVLFNDLLQYKEDENQSLKTQISDLNKNTSIKEDKLEKNSKEDDSNLTEKYLRGEYTKLKKKAVFKAFLELSDFITKHDYLPNKLPTSVINSYESQNIIEQRGDKPGFYEFTNKGKEFLKYYFDENIT